MELIEEGKTNLDEKETDEGIDNKEGDDYSAKREALKKQLLSGEMTPEQMDALFGDNEEEEELDEEAEMELAMFSARLGLDPTSLADPK